LARRRLDQGKCIVTNQRPRSPTRLWAYAYQIVPPQRKGRLDTIQGLLDHEHEAARTEARTWTGRLVLERLATRILIVSDSPDQARGVNRGLASELQRLQATFSCTSSLEIPGGDGGDRPTIAMHG
jgi:hypothetical protein